MTLGRLGPDPLELVVETALEQLARGEPVERIETTRLDLKEEPGRRAKGGSVLPGQRENEEAASYLAGEMACMANTPGGGAIIVGVADDGSRVGTELDGDWLRHRIWEISKRRLTVAVRDHRITRAGCGGASEATASRWMRSHGGRGCFSASAMTGRPSRRATSSRTCVRLRWTSHGATHKRPEQAGTWRARATRTS